MKLLLYKNICVKFLTIALALVLTLFGGVLFGQTTQTFTTNGSWTVPCGVTSVTVGVWGAGGGGAGDGTNATISGGGGGGGGYSTSTIAVTPGANIAYTIGAGGVGGIGNNNGSTGGTTTFSTVSSPGGAGGQFSTGAGGAGGIGTSGTGTPGSDGVANGAGGIGGDGANAGGAGGTSGGVGNNGIAGSSPGGGGSGADDEGGGTRNGGAGGAGQITITFSSTSAGSNQFLALCATSTTLAADAVAGPSIGTWTVAPAGPTITSPNSPTSAVTGMALDQTYTFTWTTSGGGCITASDNMTITTMGPVADAGADQSLCNASMTLDANVPQAGFTGLWTCTGGSCAGVVITDPTSPTTTVTGFNAPESVTLTWTVSGACSSSDAVVLTFPTVCNDDPCGAAPLAVTSGTCSLSTFSNVGATMSSGMPEPGCAAVNGPDVWYSVVVPASGQVQINSTTAGLFDELISIYDGSCSNLAFNGCVSGTGSNVYPLTYAGAPGSTIYIRVNEGTTGDAATGSFQICAYEATTATVSEVFPGVTTYVDCGTPLNFYDPGGQGGTTTTSTAQPPPAGNYSNNTGAQWIICPSDPADIVTIDFNEFTVETGYDKLIILSGENVIAQWTGNDGQGDIVTAQVAGECLTIILQSDYIWTAEGWEAIVSCTTAVVPPQITTACQVNNCNGGCGVWVCADGIYDTQAGAGAGIDEMNEVTGGCWGAAGEVATSWFYFTTSTAGELAFEFVPSNNGHNINFALYGPSLDGIPPCPLSTGDAPIRCSFAGAGGINTGLQAGQTDLYDIFTGDGMSAPLMVGAGETYALVVDVYQNGQPPTETEIDFTGVVSLDCTAGTPLGITLEDFYGINQGPKNLLSWTVSSQIDNDYFTLERSVNGITWEIVGNVDGAGTTQERMFYSLIDNNPYFPVSYYRLKQTDTDGKSTHSEIIAISTFKNNAEDFINNLFPNPTSDYATFIFSGKDTDTPLNVQVLNEIGQVVLEYNYSEPYDGMPATIETFDLSTGLYQVLFTQGENKQMQKLAIIR